MRQATGVLILAFAVFVFVSPNRLEGAGPVIQAVAKTGEHFGTPEKYCAVDGSLVAYDDRVVTDTETGLQWVVGPDRDTTWDEAKSWVAELVVDGGGWRMPKIKELKTLYREGVGTRNMSPLLETTGGFVWTNDMVGKGYAWGFCFEIGGEFWPRRTFSDTARAFAVRHAR
jgi:hypothetical protein